MGNYRSIPKPGKTRVVYSKNPSLNPRPNRNQPKMTAQPIKRSVVKSVKPVKPAVKQVGVLRDAQQSAVANIHRSKKSNNFRQINHAKQVEVRKQQIERINRRPNSNAVSSGGIIQNLNKLRSLKGSGVGRILAMIACGPSVAEADLERLKHPIIDIMAINKPDPRLWPPKFWAFCDQSQYLRNKELFEKFDKTDGILLNATAVKARASNQIIFRGKGGKGFSRTIENTGVFIGSSTVYANMQTALYMNYDKIYIFGIDMCKVGDKLHFYGKNPDVDDEVRIGRFKKEADNYEAAFNIMKDNERSKFRMCSAHNPWKFAELFGKIDHRKAVDIIIEEANKFLEKE